MAFPSLQDAIVPLLALLLPSLCYVVFFRTSKQASDHEPQLPKEWPVVGILPSLVHNLHRPHDYFTAVLAAAGGCFDMRGQPVMGFFCTCDPENTRHIFVSRFANYRKGELFASIFDTMGGSIFNTDDELWRRQRAKVQQVIARPQLLALMARCCRDKVGASLIPLLGRMASNEAEFDLQDVFTRFAFDITTIPVFGVDPGRLSVLEMPPMDVPDAMDAVMEVGLLRHMVPVPFWRLMRKLNIGWEKKLAAAQIVLRRFVTGMLNKRNSTGNEEARAMTPPVDIASSYMDDPEYVGDLLYAMLISYMFAGRDAVGTTLTWLMYNLIKHPRVASAIRGELMPIASRKATAATNSDVNGMVVFEPEETKPLVYLQAALFESMRLYPPAAIERKEVLADDTLPSGHTVRAGDTILIWVHAMGRMENVWGGDCMEYRPERWITKDGGALRHVPAHKFLAFNAGPRLCMGKDISVTQMKCVVASMVWNFDFEMVEGQVVEPKLSTVLQMKNGLMVKAKKRDISVEEFKIDG